MITVLTDPAVGGTFLTWSLHYLAGHDQYFLQEKSYWTNLITDPLNNNNAHKFIPNQPNRIFDCTAQQFVDFAETLNNTPAVIPHILYFHQFNSTETTKAATEYSNANALKLIVVDTSNSKLYRCSYRKRAPILVGVKQVIGTDKDIQQDLFNRFFKESKTQWDKLGLKNLWDIREFLALNFRPFEQDYIYDYVDKTRDHFIISGLELWTSLDLCIVELFRYLGISINQQRLENWQQTYNNWKKIHYQRLMFATYFDTIINGILNNHNIDLTRFDLDIEQEAAIQHVLIYKHHLNLKTWQLEKFINTKQLHNLLEPNIHPLSS